MKLCKLRSIVAVLCAMFLHFGCKKQSPESTLTATDSVGIQMTQALSQIALTSTAYGQEAEVSSEADFSKDAPNWVCFSSMAHRDTPKMLERFLNNAKCKAGSVVNIPFVEKGYQTTTTLNATLCCQRLR